MGNAVLAALCLVSGFAPGFRAAELSMDLCTGLVLVCLSSAPVVSLSAGASPFCS